MDVVEKVRRRISGEKINSLSQARKSILINSVSRSLAIHTMNCFLLSSSICSKLDFLNMDFF